ncbi:MAG: hypothetical protein RHS_2302 [Robinsoniella sp. RHS]|nr:MAG: hypothetical protein RHS_2302 [Robinsoniella sp. RHS]
MSIKNGFCQVEMNHRAKPILFSKNENISQNLYPVEKYVQEPILASKESYYYRRLI